MQKIKKGSKAREDGVMLTMKEYEDYKKLNEAIREWKEKKKQYMDEYHRGCVETFI